MVIAVVLIVLVFLLFYCEAGRFFACYFAVSLKPKETISIVCSHKKHFILLLKLFHINDSFLKTSTRVPSPSSHPKMYKINVLLQETVFPKCLVLLLIPHVALKISYYVFEALEVICFHVFYFVFAQF